MDRYLRATDTIDHRHAAVAELARALAVPGDALETARRAFAFVRDEVTHTLDAGGGPITCAASEVAIARTGFCYAKAHLLVALYRATGLPAGLCYQRLTSGGRTCLHGLAAVQLPGAGWYRVDPRGNRPGVDARFAPPDEHLAYPAEPLLPGIWPDPAPVVVEALRTWRTPEDLMAHLPDVELGPEAPPRGRFRLLLSVMAGRYAVCRLEPAAAVPGWARWPATFLSATRTPEELSIVCDEELVPPDVRCERGWSCLKIEGPLDFSLAGTLAAVVRPLAEGGVSAFTVSTFDTDYVLVRSAQLDDARRALAGAGHALR